MKNETTKYIVVMILVVTVIAGFSFANEKEEAKTAYDHMVESLTNDCMNNKAYK